MRVRTTAWLVLLSLAAGCDGGGGERQARLVEPGKLTFVASGDFRPFSYVDDQQKMVGFDVDVGTAVAHQLGLEPVALKYNFAAIIEGVKAGRFDCAVASHTVTAERQRQVSFSTPYYYSGPQVFTRADSPIHDQADLKGVEIAVSKGSTYARMAAQYTDRIRIYETDVTALEALAAGRHDAVITDFVTGRTAIQQGVAIVARTPLGRSAQAIAVAKDNPVLLARIDRALSALRASGELGRLSRRYFGEDITTAPPGQPLPERVASETPARRAEGPLMHFVHVLLASRDVFLQGAWLTVELTTVSVAIGCLIGLLFALLKLSSLPPLVWLAESYIYLVRGTPLVLQIFVLYFGLTDIVRIPAFWAAVLALAFHNGAYIAEVFRGAIQSIERGQLEAGLSLGMTTALAYRRVVLPQAAVRALPPLGNQLIIGLKDSSLAAFISMNELFNVATTQGSNHFDQMTYLLVVACYYLALVLLLSLLVAYLERRLGEGTRG